MKFKYYQVDSFTNKIFKGNPACVVQLDEWLEDEVLLKIAKENAVAETAFFISDVNGFKLRWFTPDIEIDLVMQHWLLFVIKTCLNYLSDKIFLKHEWKIDR